MWEEFVLKNMDKIAVGQGGLSTFSAGVLIWCYIKIKQQCRELFRLNKKIEGAVMKEMCDFKHNDLKDDIKDMNEQNRTQHADIFDQLKENNTAVSTLTGAVQQQNKGG